MNQHFKSAIVWQPSHQQLASSNLTKFMQFVNQQYDTDFATYSSIYQWSIEHIADFWEAVWKFCKIISTKPYTSVLQHAEHMLTAKWFTSAKLNFAENLLAHHNENKPALIFHGENGLRRELSYSELYRQVAAVAARLRQCGVTVNDRVAGYLPNIPETIIAMLATTSLGAVWSSCSPDFGVKGVVDRFGQIKPKILFTCDGQFYHGKSHNILPKVAEISAQIDSIEQIVVVPFVNETPDLSLIPKAQLYADFIDTSAKTIDFAHLDFDHPVYIMFSSGTTGVPKCIVHSAGGTLIQHLKELVLHTNLKSHETIFYYTTCGWMMWNWLVSSLAVGATLVLYDGAPIYPHADILFDLISQEKINVFGTSAKFLATIEKEQISPISTHDLVSLRCILSTGSPLNPNNYDFVYQHIKPEVQLSSISGGTDIISCFALGSPNLPVYRGELQCRGLGMAVEIFDENGNPVTEQKGELVCTKPFPSMPIYFWNDKDSVKYKAAYFEKYPNVWAHGDYAELTEHEGIIIYGRSDAILNPGGVRIGTAEIYRQVENIDEVLESVVVSQDWKDDVRIILFVKLRNQLKLDDALISKIKAFIRQNTSPYHVPAKIIQVTDIPRTISGKIVEVAVRNALHNLPIKNIESLANPAALAEYNNIPELQGD